MKFDLLFLPQHDWKKCENEGFRTRDAHLLLEFDKHPSVNKILVVDRPITLPEILIKKRPLKIKTGKLVHKKGPVFISKVTKKTFVLDILNFELFTPLVLQRRWWQHVFEKQSTVSAIKSALNIVGIERPVLWMATPLTHSVMNELETELTAFDAIDNWLVHPQAHNMRKEVASGYEALRGKADLIFANSESLKAFLSKGRKNTFFVPNGINKELFDREVASDIPSDLSRIKGPIVGYAGKIQERLDVDLINYLTAMLPGVNFVLIGQKVDRRWFKRLKPANNLHYLGDKKYEQLPRYLANFDVCIMPHTISKLTDSMNPLKIYEYLASGKPVVSTRVAGTDEFADLISLADTNNDFLNEIKRSLSLDEDAKVRLARRSIERLTGQYSWDHKSEEIVDKLTFALSEKRELNEKRAYG